MELRQLRYFIAVAERLSFREAADALCVTQPPITRQVQQLERELQCNLFKRSTRHVSLTDDGEKYLALFKGVMDDLDAAAAELTAASPRQSTTWRLRVPWFADFARVDEVQQAAVVAGLGKTIQLEPKPTTSVRRALSLRDADCVIVDHALSGADIIATPLGSVAYCIATAAVTVNEPRNQPLRHWIAAFGPLLAVRSTSDSLVRRFVATLNRNDIATPEIERHADITSLLHSLTTGRGFALFPESFQRSHPSGLDLLPMPTTLALALPYFAITRRDDDVKPLLQMLPALSRLLGALH